MLARHSRLAQSAYLDLVRMLQDEAVGEVRGAAVRVLRGGKAYWYDSYRVGAQVKRAYIGPETPELLARLDGQEKLKADAAERQAARARLVRVLRAEGLASTDAPTGSLYAGLAGAGVFRLGGTVIGTHAFRLYEGLLGLRLSLDDAAMTNDLDIASFEHLSVAVEDVAEPPVSDVLKGFDYEPVPGLKAGKVWRWRSRKDGALVEFLTPSFRKAEDLRPLTALGVMAQSLHFLNYLIAEPVPAAALYRSGVLVQVPRPERYAVHKLIVAARRRGEDLLKADKDRAQAAMLIDALCQDRPDDLKDALETARGQGPKWGGLIDKSLRRMALTRALVEEL
ncbi:MAG: GSU2403 family nucleotidyltransferase fold protein [Rhizobiaceae bacterium]